jgi:hypothetical protein
MEDLYVAEQVRLADLVVVEMVSILLVLFQEVQLLSLDNHILELLQLPIEVFLADQVVEIVLAVVAAVELVALEVQEVVVVQEVPLVLDIHTQLEVVVLLMEQVLLDIILGQPQAVLTQELAVELMQVLAQDWVDPEL